MWILYCLLRLLSTGEPIFLKWGARFYFFFDKVYTVSAIGRGVQPPRAKGERGNGLVVFLMDASSDNEDERINAPDSSYPIVACEPRPKRWRRLQKILVGSCWGMPLWEEDELLQG